MDLKIRIDAFRRHCEQLIAGGRYRPTCTPAEWWALWAQLEHDLGIAGA
ncbi:MAG TPA: hypothetical protein VFZ66_29850 [Herpetosiphonaceae bacterium]